MAGGGNSIAFASNGATIYSGYGANETLNARQDYVWIGEGMDTITLPDPSQTFVDDYWGYYYRFDYPGYQFVSWNTVADNSGTSYQVGDLVSYEIGTLYAIWEPDSSGETGPIPGLLEITYNGSQTFTTYVPDSYMLPTAGKFLTDDIQVAFNITTKGSATYTPTTTNQIISAGQYLTGSQTILGSPDLLPENIVEGVSIFGVSGTLQRPESHTLRIMLASSAGSFYINSTNAQTTITYVDGKSINVINQSAFANCTNLSYISFPMCTTIESYAFNGCIGLTEVSFPACTTINNYAFSDCTGLTEISFPICTSIGSYAFQNCTELTEVSFSVCTSIGAYAFSGCTNLTSIHFNILQTIPSTVFRNLKALKTLDFPSCILIANGSAFRSCEALTEISFPVCTSIGSYAFQNCTELIEVSFPVCTSIGAYAFSGCTNLTSIHFNALQTIPIERFSGFTKLKTLDFPVCTSITGHVTYGAFYNCTALSEALFPVCAYIGSRTFRECTALQSLWMLNSTQATLKNSNAFGNTKLSTTGSIYVPASLVDSYKTATNWTYFSNNIFGI